MVPARRHLYAVVEVGFAGVGHPTAYAPAHWVAAMAVAADQLTYGSSQAVEGIVSAAIGSVACILVVAKV